MLKKANIYIGYDSREIIAYHVLCQSILKYSSIPVSFTPLKLDHFSKFYKRKKGPKDSTEFSISRFLVPYLSNFKGISIYLDCDMLFLDDIFKLIKLTEKSKHKSLWCIKHKHLVMDGKKFLKEKQLHYDKKNWSSLMIFNNEKCKILTPAFIEKANGLDLHQFKWTKDSKIGGLPTKWNILSGYQKINNQTKNIHFTEGGPYFKEYIKSKGANKWFRIKKEIC